MTTKTQKKAAQLNGAKPMAKKHVFELSWSKIREIYNCLLIMTDFEETSMRTLIKLSYNCKVVQDKLKDLEAKEEPLNKLRVKLNEKFEITTDEQANAAPKEYKTQWKGITEQSNTLHAEVEKVELELVPKSDFPGDSKEDRKKFPSKVIMVGNQPQQVSQVQAFLTLLMEGVIVENKEEEPAKGTE